MFQTIFSCAVCPIRRMYSRTDTTIPEKSPLAVEIDLTWSRGFVSVELGRFPNPLSCKTLLICPICISKVLIEAHRFLIAASVEARISLIMFEFCSCLLADSAIILNPGPAALYCPPVIVSPLHIPASELKQRTLSHYFFLFSSDTVELAWIAAKPVRSSVLLGS
ncbi:hypothetical protein Tco_0896275 [Tanacetum coccineum]